MLQILRARLKQEPALTCADIDNALRSRTVNEPQVANEFQNFKCKDQRFEVAKKYEDAKPHIRLRMIEKGSERKEKTEYYVEESKSNESENIQKAEKSAEVERQVYERDEPKSKRAKKRARKKERAVKNQFSSEQPVSESAIQLRMSKRESEGRKIIENIESEEDSKSDESENIQNAVKSAEVEKQVHERDEPKSKRAKKRARKREKNRCASEQPEPDEYKEDERKQMKYKQNQNIQFSAMAASPQSGAESDRKSVKESEKIAPEIMSTGSENEPSDACKKKKCYCQRVKRQES